MRENGAASGAGVLATYAYDNLGRRTGVARGNGVVTSYGYDAASRLTSLSHDLAGSSQDVTFTYTHDPAFGIRTRQASNALYVVDEADQSTTYVLNGQNQIVSADGQAFAYDANKNLTDDGTGTYGYDALNRLTTVGSTVQACDPAGRLERTRRVAAGWRRG